MSVSNLQPVHLFSPLQLREVQFRNRIVVSPMRQYSSTDGYANDWHLVHLGSRAVDGGALVFTEAAAVLASARTISGSGPTGTLKCFRAFFVSSKRRERCRGGSWPTPGARRAQTRGTYDSPVTDHYLGTLFLAEKC
jgi:hypothetical protein